MSIFDLVTSQELAAYWTILSEKEEQFLGDELFPPKKKLGLTLRWIKGAKGLPVELKSSAFDVQAIPRARIAFNKMSADMPYFKESTYVDEETRQELNLVLETGNQAYIESIMNKVFDDEMSLLRSARVSRERMRMMAITTGLVTIESNGQILNFDYGVNHKGNASSSWATTNTASPIDDLRKAMDEVQDSTGVRPTRVVMNRKTWGYLLKNQAILKTIFVMTNGIGQMNDNRLKQFLMDELDIQVAINDSRYADSTGTAAKYIPDDTVVLLPPSGLGNTWFGTTPEESDLMTGSVANVSIVDNGVAITTIKNANPVNVETIVSMICLPSFEMADQIYIMDVTP